MKVNELLNVMPHLYLDMDGVQADFFGALADKHHVAHWKAIKNKETEVEDLAQSSANAVYSFFRDLKPLSSGKAIVDWLNSNNIPYTVLSAPLRGPFADESIKAKIDWLDEYYPGSSKGAIFTSEKQQYAVTNGLTNVLVDDFGPYINNWKNAGGIAVKHEDEVEDPNAGKTTILALQKIYGPFLGKK